MQDKLSIIAELPGLSKNDLDISLEHNRLSICGSVKQEKEERDTANNVVLHSERSFGSFCRTIPVHEGIKPEDIKASMENGLLKVELPCRGKAAVQVQRIEIK